MRWRSLTFLDTKGACFAAGRNAARPRWRVGLAIRLSDRLAGSAALLSQVAELGASAFDAERVRDGSHLISPRAAGRSRSGAGVSQA